MVLPLPRCEHRDEQHGGQHRPRPRIAARLQLAIQQPCTAGNCKQHQQGNKKSAEPFKRYALSAPRQKCDDDEEEQKGGKSRGCCSGKRSFRWIAEPRALPGRESVHQVDNDCRDDWTDQKWPQTSQPHELEELLENSPTERRSQSQVVIPNPGDRNHLRDHTPSIQAPDIGEAEHQIERLIARQAGLHVAQYEHRKHDTGDRGGDDAIGPHLAPAPAQMDQAQSSPTKTLSNTPIA